MMQSYNPSAPQSGVLQQMSDARSTCRELMELLGAENGGLIHQKVAEVETRLQMKRTLTLRLEVLMQEIKRRKAEWQAQPTAKDMANRLAEDMAVFQELASKNLTLLQAAHQLRADMVAVIRDTLDARAPHVPVYGRTGSVYKQDNGTRVISRDA